MDVKGEGRRRVVAAHQPAYLPWLGYFHRIAAADAFVFLDDVQFEKNSFTNRNQIKTDGGPLWLTIPVVKRGHLSSTMMSMIIDDRADWRRKHLETIRLAYRRAPHFDLCFQQLESLYGHDDELLKDACLRHLQFWLSKFGLETEVIPLHTLQIKERKSELVLSICKALDAGVYLSGPFGRDYLDVETFRDAGIAVEFQKFTHPIYPQLHGPFLPRMGVVDAWMNVGDQLPSLLHGAE